MSDREKLYKLLQEATIANAHYPSGQFAIQVVDHLIANGVVIQKQGEWEESTNYDVGFWVCSVCNFTSEATAASKLYKYCPNCGAKMKEVK